MFPSLQPIRSTAQPLGRRSGVRHTAAFSLLEVVVGMVVVALILVPTTQMMSDVLAGDTTQRLRSEMLHLAEAKQAELCHLSRTDFRELNQSGNFAKLGNAQIYYTGYCTQDPSLGGVQDRLMAISVQTWTDLNHNRRLDSSEPTFNLWTAVARATP